jgi:tetratricopeptide (TPR) repeat protein
MIKSALMRIRDLACDRTVHCLLLGLLAFFAMQPVLHAGFVNWDDVGYIFDNPAVRSLSPHNIAAIFLHRALKLYTPLAVFSLALDYSFFGHNPAGYHFVNLIFHICNSALAYILLRMLLEDYACAFFAAAFFAVHPMHVESVAWIAERKDMLYAFFFLLSCIFYLRWKQSCKGGLRAVSVACFALSLLSKPMAASLPLVLLWMDWVGGGFGSLKKSLREKLAYFLLAAGAVAVAIAPRGAENVGAHSGFLLRIVTPFYNMVFYACKLVFPQGLCAVYNVPAGGLAIMSLWALVCLAALFALWSKFRSDRLIAGGLAFYILTLLPVIQLVPFGPVLSADRYSYVPSLGLFLVWAGLARQLARRFPERAKQARIFVSVFALSLILVFAVESRARALVWHNGLSLWTDAVEKQPCPMSLANLGQEWLALGRPDIAANLFTASLKMNPAHVLSLVGLANCRNTLGDMPGALKLYLAALDIEPFNPVVHANIANAEFAMGNSGSAISEMRTAIKLAGFAPNYWSALAAYMLKLRDYAGAKDALLHSYAQEPAPATAGHLCALYCATGDCAAGQQYCAAARR